MWVKAKPGLKCPKEGAPRSYVTDAEAVEVPNSSYYVRLVGEGSLLEVAEPKKSQGGDK